MSETPHVPPSVPPPGGSFTPPPPPPPSATPPASDRTLFLVLSYLGIFALIPLLAKKDDPEVQWHAKNGTALFIAELVWVAIGIAFLFAGAHIPFLGCGWAVVRCAVWIGFLILSIVCIVKATQGKRFRIPIITDMAEKM